MFSATTLLTGSGDVLQYILDNIILFGILVACLVLIIIIIVILCVAKKKKKEPVALPSEEDEQTISVSSKHESLYLWSQNAGNFGQMPRRIRIN